VREGCDGALDLTGVAHVDRVDLHPERRRHGLDGGKLGGPTGCSGIAKDRDACHAACKKQSGDQSVSRTSMVALSLRQRVEYGLRLLEIAGVEAFAEAPIDG
jgi:hypothetical protein